MSILVTGIGIALAGVDTPADLLGEPRPDSEPVDPRARLGRKGLRYKDRATQLGYCAVRDALTEARLLDEDGTALGGDRTAVVASSNYGNLDTICRTVDTIAADTAGATSPMDLPNASSNVLASSVAIRFGLTGPNLMLCNGETSGTDAVRWAMTLIAAGRADRAVVIGAEPDTDPARRLTGRTQAFDGAAALVLEHRRSAGVRGVRAVAVVGGHARSGGLPDCVEALDALGGRPPTAWQSPDGDAVAAGGPAGVRDLGVAGRWPGASGALGVLQCAASAGYFAAGGVGPVYAVTGGGDAGPAAGLLLVGPQEAG
ncbi:beta-ketoacyl synthase N-terminal-like domain-containing protein [Streptomyces griseus]|uniref:Beta-ketoacyl synthase-like N-terminal domain-containing protein n=1 Tax=Streptomyces sp. CMC78 TaxID=3231512 RepID=A0AB33KFL1_9ACTN|nr:beta-ketoacyl synthase N-terminal-like domain-containing protein [Streptomyces sp. ID01-9D]MDX5574067.1 beta-ketoacyl synthase N-terminal-like domain-containing protein [Streptomyces sp. ID01-9D]WSV22835.1 3-oxoacyl-ACP synthase [Streptomyces fimicarius]WTC88268.1 3-oxoacyl-ACP synthase [Streptomyces griseus]WTD69108.1 3-oxoacyl-ACP synthase [Streptomyces griseus]